ncbi:GNAT family N-acetyltransferase [Maribellus sediminis]|uniref:GNAT family N-acetyltransferase n=1 Tax=Maribellus sediminis TaxID=2696285 RepID=UPI00142F9F70|nr:GNAT family N-acetyltransferase [Maribellus sediminis]
MVSIRRTNSKDEDFVSLVAELNAFLAIMDGREHEFYNQFNQIEDIRHVVIAYVEEKPVSCGAIKAFDADSMEVKRMFTIEAYRGKGIAGRVLTELETWTQELALSKCVLETGKRLPDAIRLYTKNGYQQIPNYGQYVGMENSVCFEKLLIKK